LDRPRLACEHHRASRESHRDRRPRLNPLGRVGHHCRMNQGVAGDLRNREPIKPKRLGLLSCRGKLGPVGFPVERVDSHPTPLPRLGPAIQGTNASFTQPRESEIILSIDRAVQAPRRGWVCGTCLCFCCWS
jgi:hypothetical protein